MKIPIKLILIIISEIFKLIAAHVPEDKAFSHATAKFGVSEDLLRKFF